MKIKDEDETTIQCVNSWPKLGLGQLVCLQFLSVKVNKKTYIVLDDTQVYTVHFSFIFEIDIINWSNTDKVKKKKAEKKFVLHY